MNTWEKWAIGLVLAALLGLMTIKAIQHFAKEYVDVHDQTTK